MEAREGRGGERRGKWKLFKIWVTDDSTFQNGYRVTWGSLLLIMDTELFTDMSLASRSTVERNMGPGNTV